MTAENETILIVDDERLNRKLLRAHLISAGYTVREASSGAEALREAEEMPDLILLDIMMPAMNGFETCRRLKEKETTQGIPVIFLSALKDSATRVYGLNSGGVDYICKPFDGPELLARVRTHLTLKRQEREISLYAGKLAQMVEERTRQLIHADRLATIGTFAAAVVHEINSPLTYIGGNAELLKLFWDSAESILELHTAEDSTGMIGRRIGKVGSYLQGILDGQQRIIAILDTLRSYARKDGGAQEPHPLINPINDALRLLQHRFKRGVTIQTSIPADIRVWCDPRKLSQVFINLFNNAIDAMEGERGHIVVEAVRSDGRVTIHVSDSGPGIPEEIAERVFDPFFTSKGEVRGTGLGLFIVRNIIEEYEGKISLAPKSCTGAVFCIDLPMFQEARAETIKE